MNDLRELRQGKLFIGMYERMKELGCSEKDAQEGFTHFVKYMMPQILSGKKVEDAAMDMVVHTLKISADPIAQEKLKNEDLTETLKLGLLDYTEEFHKFYSVYIPMEKLTIWTKLCGKLPMWVLLQTAARSTDKVLVAMMSRLCIAAAHLDKEPADLMRTYAGMNLLYDKSMEMAVMVFFKSPQADEMSQLFKARGRDPLIVPPRPKSDNPLTNALQEMFEARKDGRCPFCKKSIALEEMLAWGRANLAPDELISFRKEYAISGICFDCQKNNWPKEE